MSVDLAAIARDLKLPPEKVEKTVQLLDDGNTIPFITRFRKDETGGLNEKQIQSVKQAVKRERAISERRSFILKSIESQGRLTPELRHDIDQATTTRRLEDLYLPFKPKKQTLATLARQQGLEPFATEIFEGRSPELDLAAHAVNFVRVEKGLASVDDVIAGVGHLIAERLSEFSELRSELRKILWNTGQLVSQAIESTQETETESTTPSNAKQEAAEDLSVSPAQTGGPESTTIPETLSSESGAPADAASAVPSSTTSANTQTSESQSDAEPAEPLTAETPVSNTSSDHGVSQATSQPENPGDPVPTKEKLTSSEVTASTEASPDALADEAEAAPVDSAVTNASSQSVNLPAEPSGVSEQSKPTKKRKKKKKKVAPDPYRDYHDFKQLVKKIPHHRVLAINRGERAGKLRVKMDFDNPLVVATAKKMMIPAEHPAYGFMEKCLSDALAKSVIPSLEREIRRELAEVAERHAVDVFANNLKNLLLQPPIDKCRILAIDPGFKRGCTVAALDENGDLVETTQIFVVGNVKRRESSVEKIRELIKKHKIDLIAIGNGTACRETEQLVSDAIRQNPEGTEVKYVILNEAGASTYSTSEIGREELPNLTPHERSAVSIGRRLLDPLSELVKISPANIGVGMYQHDVKAKHLSESLDEVVEFCVNRVGVNVNTASPSLLRYVSGLNQLTARRVYEYRQTNGPFKDRQQLKTVTGFGDATFVQAAGFLRICDGEEPLDATSIHPESYVIAQKLLEKVGATADAMFRPLPEPEPEVVQQLPDTQVQTSATSSAVPLDETSQATNVEDAKSADETAVTPSPTPPSEAEKPTGSSERPVATSDETIAQKVHDTHGPSRPTPKYDPKRSEFLAKLKQLDIRQLADEFTVGSMLVSDILKTFSQPRRDPRDGVSKPIFRSGIIKADDLQPGMQLDAQVVNVVDFGAFVDIGLGESCLIHVSQLSNRFIRDPHQYFAVGDVVKVWVTEVEGDRRRVKLTAIKPGTPKFDPTKPRRKPADRKTSDRKPVGAKRYEGSQSRKSTDNKGQGNRRGKPAHARRDRPRKHTPKTVTPITKEMLDGKEPMRSFSDLLQFVEKKPTSDSENKDKS